MALRWQLDLLACLIIRIQVANGFYLARDVKLTNDIVRAGMNYKFDSFAP